MKRIDHPHVEIDGSCGPAGTLRAHFHSSCPTDGLTFQCPAMRRTDPAPCDHVWTISWDELDELNKDRLEAERDEVILLPACPKCGARTVVCHNDVEYGQELPEHTTMRIVRQHIAKRAAFKHLSCFPASMDGKHNGFDFSHLPVKERPACHRKVDVAAELAELANPPEAPRIIGDTDA